MATTNWNHFIRSRMTSMLLEPTITSEASYMCMCTVHHPLLLWTQSFLASRLGLSSRSAGFPLLSPAAPSQCPLLFPLLHVTLLMLRSPRVQSSNPFPLLLMLLPWQCPSFSSLYVPLYSDNSQCFILNTWPFFPPTSTLLHPDACLLSPATWMSDISP